MQATVNSPLRSHSFHGAEQRFNYPAYGITIRGLPFFSINVYKRRMVDWDIGCFIRLLGTVPKVVWQYGLVAKHTWITEIRHLESEEHNDSWFDHLDFILQIIKTHLHFLFVWVAKFATRIQRGTFDEIRFVETYPQKLAFNRLNDIPGGRFWGQRDERFARINSFGGKSHPHHVRVFEPVQQRALALVQTTRCALGNLLERRFNLVQYHK
jgi:hypothetical protein